MRIRETMPPVPPRWNGPNQWHFVTVITHKRQSLFTDTDSCEILKHAFPEDFAYHLEYIRLHVIKHGYAESAEAYQGWFIHQHPFEKGNFGLKTAIIQHFWPGRHPSRAPGRALNQHGESPCHGKPQP